jgi:hypothetical protein
MLTGGTVALHAQAAANLRYIRACMRAAAAVPVPGTAMLMMGTTGCAAAVVAALAGALIIARQYALQGLPLLASPLRKFLLCVLPGLFAGAALTAVDVSTGNLHAIPGSWLLLYGCTLTAAAAVTAASVGWLGIVFATLGLIALLLPDALQNLLLGAGFGALHMLFGLYLRREP